MPTKSDPNPNNEFIHTGSGSLQQTVLPSGVSAEDGGDKVGLSKGNKSVGIPRPQYIIDGEGNEVFIDPEANSKFVYTVNKIDSILGDKVAIHAKVREHLIKRRSQLLGEAATPAATKRGAAKESVKVIAPVAMSAAAPVPMRVLAAAPAPVVPQPPVSAPAPLPVRRPRRVRNSHGDLVLPGDSGDSKEGVSVVDQSMVPKVEVAFMSGVVNPVVRYHEAIVTGRTLVLVFDRNCQYASPPRISARGNGANEESIEMVISYPELKVAAEGGASPSASEISLRCIYLGQSFDHRNFRYDIFFIDGDTPTAVA